MNFQEQEIANDEFLAVANQVEGHPDVVLRQTPAGEVLRLIPNGTELVVLDAPDESLTVERSQKPYSTRPPRRRDSLIRHRVSWNPKALLALPTR